MKFKVMAAIFALALIAGAAAVTLSLVPALGSGDSGGNVDGTFIKWVTDNDLSTFPIDMAGVVGGDVGAGSFFGEVLSRDDTSKPGTVFVHALYHFNGGKHSFTADLSVTETTVTAVINGVQTDGTAVLNGVVTDGWRKGERVEGEYTVMHACPIPTPGNVYGTRCWQGTLHIMGGSAD